ncbi:MAG: LysM peptidoglycan-binding domain-containing protein, partial [Gammaproteobacteria bacterium]|nr:LysM peptidoglycan-binding domain-containing protein [Gammaproteobacteria bacterium]
MQKLGLISSLWVALLLFPLTGFSLGLGEIEASSYLNQPLKAEIQVNSARPGEIDDLLISLATRDAFRKAGLERPAGLSKLKFKVEKSEDGQSARILVTTKTPVKEPFLSFLVEADWAKGRLLREFTILLDPISFAQQAAVQAAAQVSPEQSEVEPAVSQSDSVIQRKTDDQGSNQVIPAPIATTSESPSNENEVPYDADSEDLSSSPSVGQVVVAKGDTLWAIASQFKDEGHSMAQVMLAMQMMNPDAFSKDNINNLKVGAVLRVPDMDVMDRLSKQEAYAQVLDQNGLWDEYVARKSGETSSAMADASTGVGSSQQETDKQLNLLTAEEGDSESASLQKDADTESSGQIRKQLALAEEELEAARLQNTDLKSRIEMLEQQQSKFQEL